MSCGYLTNHQRLELCQSDGQTLPYRLRKVCRQRTQFPVAGLSRRDRLGFFGNNQDRPRIIFPDASRLVSQEAGLRNDLLIVYNCRYLGIWQSRPILSKALSIS